MEMSQPDIDKLNQLRLTQAIDPSTLLEGIPKSKIEPIGGLGGISEREAFGGPLYQIMNPSGRSIVDTLGSRGMGIGGFAAEMAFGPSKTKAIGKGISSLPMSEKIMDKAFQLDKSRPAPKEVIETLVNKRRNLIKKQAEDFSLDDDAYYAIYDEIEAIEKQLNNFGIDNFSLNLFDEGTRRLPNIPELSPIFGSVRKKIRKIIENASFFDPQKAIGKQTIIEKAKETSPISAKIIEKIGDQRGGMGGDYMGTPYFMNKMGESGSIRKAMERVSNQLDLGPPNPKNLMVGVGTFPNKLTTKPYNLAEKTSMLVPFKGEFLVGTEATPFFVDPKKLADKLTMSGTGADFFKVRGASILDDGKSKELTENIKKFGYSPNEPIYINITPLGYAHLDEGNHRLAKALIENYDEIPVSFRYISGAERVNHDFAINKLDKFVATGKKGYKTPKEMKTFANKRTIEARSIKSKSDLQKDLDELQELFAQQAAKFQRAKNVEQSAIRDGYLPDIEKSQKIMRTTDSYGKVLREEMDRIQKLIDNYGDT